MSPLHGTELLNALAVALRPEMVRIVEMSVTAGPARPV
jgi:hypothetical protein